MFAIDAEECKKMKGCRVGNNGAVELTMNERIEKVHYSSIHKEDCP